MSFDLTIATKRDPLEGRANGEIPAKAVAVTVVLNGLLTNASPAAIVDVITTEHLHGATTIIVEIADVTVESDAPLARFAEELMLCRSRGVHVQALVRDPTLHSKFERMPQSRDWLLAARAIDTATPRIALHVDAPRSSGVD